MISKYFFNQWEGNQNQSGLGRTSSILIGSFCCLHLLWLARVISLVLVWRHSIENCSISEIAGCWNYQELCIWGSLRSRHFHRGFVLFSLFDCEDIGTKGVFFFLVTISALSNSEKRKRNPTETLASQASLEVINLAVKVLIYLFLKVSFVLTKTWRNPIVIVTIYECVEIVLNGTDCIISIEKY